MDFSYFRKLVNQISFALHSTYISYYEIQIRLFFDSSLNILGAFWERGSERSKKMLTSFVNAPFQFGFY